MSDKYSKLKKMILGEKRGISVLLDHSNSGQWASWRTFPTIYRTQLFRQPLWQLHLQYPNAVYSNVLIDVCGSTVTCSRLKSNRRFFVFFWLTETRTMDRAIKVPLYVCQCSQSRGGRVGTARQILIQMLHVCNSRRRKKKSLPVQPGTCSYDWALGKLEW